MHPALGIMSGLGLPRVRAFCSLDELTKLKDSLDALNMASRRPSPFGTFAYMRAFSAHNEFARPGERALFLVAFDGDAPVGFLPLQKVPERLHGISYTTVRCLLRHDNDRPRVVARAGDEPRCAEAFYNYLLRVDRSWSFLELAEQDAESGLLKKAPPSSLFHHYVRRYPNNPNATLDLSTYRTVEDYLGAMEGKHRQNLRHAVKKLLDDCAIEIISSSDPRALPALFELYLDLERRSWKAGVSGHIGRHPERIAFFRDLLGPSSPMGMAIHVMLHDGLPIAGIVMGSFAGRAYAFEEAFDEAYRRLAPGNTMMLFTIHDAITRGRRSLNLFGNYAYYKAHWLATITETEAVQVYRVGSAVHVKAILGAIMRKIRPPITQRDANFNLMRRSPDEAPKKAPPFEPPPRASERERVKPALRALEAGPDSFARFSSAALRDSLLGAEVAHKGKGQTHPKEVTP